MSTVTVISFGYLHGPAPAADRVLDVRQILSDPARCRHLAVLDFDGRVEEVRQIVLATPRARELVLRLAASLALRPAGAQYRLAIGCAGGKHRSVALGEAVAATLHALGHTVHIDHLHAHLPRVPRAGGEA